MVTIRDSQIVANQKVSYEIRIITSQLLRSSTIWLLISYFIQHFSVTKRLIQHCNFVDEKDLEGRLSYRRMQTIAVTQISITITATDAPIAIPEICNNIEIDFFPNWNILPSVQILRWINADTFADICCAIKSRH